MPDIQPVVGASSDDCFRSTDTKDYFSIGAGFFAGYYTASYKDSSSAARFLNVTIPVGATILSAKLKLIASYPRSSTIVNTRLRCEKNINPITFSDKVDFDARMWTTAFVNWDAIAAWTVEVEYESPDIKTCIQEVINLPSWASGNPMAVLWDDFEKRSTQADFTIRQAYSWDDNAAKAPKLYIEWTTDAFVDINTRFRLEVPVGYVDVDGRFRLMVADHADVVTRFRLTSLPYYVDIPTRFILEVPVRYVDISTRFRLLSPIPGLPYTLEIRDSSGNLVAILENAHNISYQQLINTPHVLQFDLPATDSKVSDVTLANELWLRDGRTNAVIRKFLLKRKWDVRQ